MFSLWIRSSQPSPQSRLSPNALPSDGEASRRNGDAVEGSRGEVGGGRRMDISVASNSRRRDFRADMIPYRTHNIHSGDIRMLSEQTAAACTVEDVRGKTMSSKQGSFDGAAQENSNLRSVSMMNLCKWTNSIEENCNTCLQRWDVTKNVFLCLNTVYNKDNCPYQHFPFSPFRLLNNGNSSPTANSLSIIKSIGEQICWKVQIFIFQNVFFSNYDAIAELLFLSWLLPSICVYPHPRRQKPDILDRSLWIYVNLKKE